MAFISNNVKDASLNYIRMQTTEIHVCSQEPTTYSEASLTYSLGSKTSPSIGIPIGDPRAINIQSFNDGIASGTGVALYYAFVSALELIAVGPLQEAVNIVIGYDFGMPDFQIAINTDIL